jgi:hypothetical protein
MDHAKRLAQRQHDALFKAPHGCLAEVQRIAGEPVGNYVAEFHCSLCGWTGRVSGRALAAALVAQGAE